MNEQSNRRLLRWLLVGLTAIVIVIAGVALFAGGQKSNKNESPRAQTQPKDVANSFMKSVVTTDESASYKLMTDRLQKELGSDIRWGRFLNSRFAGEKETVILSETRDVKSEEKPAPRQFVYSVEITDEIAERVTLVLRYSNNTWKVDAFKFATGGL